MNTLRLSCTLDGPPWQAPRSFKEWSGQLLCVEVPEGGVASVFHEQQLVATLFSARHWIYVLDDAEERGDVRLEEIAVRSGMESADLRAIATRIHYFDRRSELIHMDTRSLPTWEIGGESPALVRAHLQTPGRFYASFLRNTETLSAEQFHTVSCALVADCMHRATPTPEKRIEFVARGLAEVGLALEELEFTGRQDISTNEATAVVETPSLATLHSPR
jgi:hypothetical protein